MECWDPALEENRGGCGKQEANVRSDGFNMLFPQFHIILFFPLTACGYITQAILGKIHKKTPHRAAVESWLLGLLNKEEEAAFIPCLLVMADFCFPYGCNLFRIAGGGGSGTFCQSDGRRFHSFSFEFPVKTEGLFLHVSGSFGISLIKQHLK